MGESEAPLIPDTFHPTTPLVLRPAECEPERSCLVEVFHDAHTETTPGSHPTTVPQSPVFRVAPPTTLFSSTFGADLCPLGIRAVRGHRPANPGQGPQQFLRGHFTNVVRIV